MPKRLEVLGGILKHIDNFDMTTFKGRLIFQKTVYLLQIMGIFLGYRFNWYIYGPYSPSLTRDGFELAGGYTRLARYHFRNARQQDLFKRFKRFLGDHENNPIWLEAAASIHFLRTLYPSKSRKEIVRRVKAKQPYFNLSICNTAWDELMKAGLITVQDEDYAGA